MRHGSRRSTWVDMGRYRTPGVRLGVRRRYRDVTPFLGTWYEIERFYADYEANGKCTKVEYSTTPDGRIALISTALHARTGRPLVSYGVGSFDYSDLSRMSVRLSPTPSSPEPEEFPYLVLDTDYESYAVLFSCSSLCRGQYHTETAWILGRAAAISRGTLGQIYSRLRGIGIDPKRFLAVDQSDCVDVSVAVRSDDPNFVFSRNRARNFLAGFNSNNFLRR
ncbi:unnamed protein product [Darwinula stevensoni]|uniref:Lipocalin/cytosolic fatty-acid binding domain-containing protein n=1 Tax=Darwinula stevensoni TaxID=69355 RepID=A0A7R9AGJ6_9CRUS|nr:unnamed protein product [Darwinula stevensoni]CAG0904404.1 unnamed protein product [Darwinula stevensoni]